MAEQASGPNTGAFIRSRRLEAGLTLRQLAGAIRVSTGTMSAVENGKVGLTVDRLRDIAEALAVPVTYLLRPPPPESPQDRSGPSVGLGDWRIFRAINLDPVLASAVEVFCDTGYHGATMRLIAAGADISVAGIYHHYPSKKHLLVELIRRAHEELRWRLEEAAAAGADPSEAFANMVEALVLFREQRRSMAFVMVTEASRAEVLADTGSEQEREEIRVAFERVTRSAIQSGAFEQTEPLLTINAILTMCLAPSAWLDPTPERESVQLARSYAGLALSMMRYRDHQLVQGR